MQSYKVGLLIGRFQPFHKGHLYLLKKSLDQIDQLIIGIGTPDRIDKDNPYSFEQRKKMLEKVIEQEKWKDKIITIIPIKDYLEDDQLWLRKTLKTVEKFARFDFFVGNDPWTDGIFEKNGYKVLRFGFYKRYLLEGVKIRKLIREEKKWQDRIPDYLVKIAT